MGRAAIINSETKIVENVILTDDAEGEEVSYTPPEGSELIPDPDGTAWIGSTWNGTEFSTPPPEPDPEPIGE